MQSNRPIMVAVDLSDFSPILIRYGAWLHRQTGAELILVNIINRKELETVQRVLCLSENFSYPDYLDQQIQAREEKLRSLYASIEGSESACRCLARDGLPYEEILALTESEQAGMLVVGTKGRSNLADVVVGSTARKLYRRSPIPLLVVPAGYAQLP